MFMNPFVFMQCPQISVEFLFVCLIFCTMTLNYVQIHEATLFMWKQRKKIYIKRCATWPKCNAV